MTQSPQPGEILSGESVTPAQAAMREMMAAFEAFKLANDARIDAAEGRLAAPSVERTEGHGSFSPEEAKIPTVQADGSGVGWLIEDQNEPQWLTLKPAEALWSMVFTKDSLEALRFSRREDAEDYIRAHLDDAPVCITEHSWPVLTTTAAEPGTVGMSEANELKTGGDETEANAPQIQSQRAFEAGAEPDVAGARERLLAYVGGEKWVSEIYPGDQIDRTVALKADIRLTLSTDEGALPADVVELVIAARIVAFEDQSPSAIKRLDAASEAFAERVPWSDEPEDEQ